MGGVGSSCVARVEGLNTSPHLTTTGLLPAEGDQPASPSHSLGPPPPLPQLGPSQPQAPPQQVGWGESASQTLTPRELLQRRLEWGEPLRSRDTCFRTSAATVLRGQEGDHRGQENLGSRALGTGALGPTDSY